MIWFLKDILQYRECCTAFSGMVGTIIFYESLSFPEIQNTAFLQQLIQMVSLLQLLHFPPTWGITTTVLLLLRLEVNLS